MAFNSQTRLVDTADGRRLRVEIAGDSDRVVLAHLGTPNAGVLFERWVRDALARSLRLVTYDRPGIFQAPWGFEVASISIPMKVWHGAQDGFVAYRHGRWLVEEVAGAEADLNDRDGHMTVAAERIGDVHAWLARYL